MIAVARDFSQIVPTQKYSDPALLYLQDTIYGSGYGKVPSVKDELTGFNYSRGKKVHVTIYRMRKLTFDAPGDAPPGRGPTGVP